MSYVTHGPCPKCGSRDNLATYADGHQWCFGCSYYVPPEYTLKSRVENLNDKRSKYASVAECPAIPKDCTPQLGSEGLRWIKSYGITDEELSRNSVLWSDSRRQLVFPIFGQDGEGVIAWQARNFEPEAAAKRKYFTAGQIDEVLHGIRCHANDSLPDGGQLPDKAVGTTLGRRTIILTEDLVSAIKVGRHCHAMPIFGSNVSESRLNRLRKLYSGVVVWLDYDKRKEARIAVKRALRVGLDARVIVTKLDPKELSDQEIIKELENGT